MIPDEGMEENTELPVADIRGLWGNDYAAPIGKILVQIFLPVSEFEYVTYEQVLMLHERDRVFFAGKLRQIHSFIQVRLPRLYIQYV